VTFDLVGAAYSHLAHHDAATELLLPVVLLALLATSYVLRPETRRLSGALAGPPLKSACRAGPLSPSLDARRHRTRRFTEFVRRRALIVRLPSATPANRPTSRVAA